MWNYRFIHVQGIVIILLVINLAGLLADYSAYNIEEYSSDSSMVLLVTTDSPHKRLLRVKADCWYLSSGCCKSKSFLDLCTTIGFPMPFCRKGQLLLVATKLPHEGYYAGRQSLLEFGRIIGMRICPLDVRRLHHRESGRLDTTRLPADVVTLFSLVLGEDRWRLILRYADAVAGVAVSSSCSPVVLVVASVVKVNVDINVQNLGNTKPF